MSEMRLLTKYFGTVDGGVTPWPEVEAAFDKVMHPDVKIPGKDTTFDFAAWKNVVKGLVNDKGEFHILKAIREPDHIFIQAAIKFPDASRNIDSIAKFFFQDGKLIRTEPGDATVTTSSTRTTNKRSLDSEGADIAKEALVLYKEHNGISSYK